MDRWIGIGGLEACWERQDRWMGWDGWRSESIYTV
jgi:hypothetical protein